MTDVQDTGILEMGDAQPTADGGLDMFAAQDDVQVPVDEPQVEAEEAP